MFRKRDVLEQLHRDELLYALDGFDLEVADRRVRDQLIAALASSRRAAPTPKAPPTPRTKAPGRPPPTAAAARKLTLRQLERHLFAAADMQNGDTLAEPMHVSGGELMRFDRVITNPPFSQNYTRDGIPFAERFRFGCCPESGKKADLMFVQHMLAVLRPNGMVVTVMPHGVLFRGGAEREIRTGILDSDQLDAVIGLGANLFYGTGIPACILVLRAPGAKPRGRRGKVLFSNRKLSRSISFASSNRG